MPLTRAQEYRAQEARKLAEEKAEADELAAQQHARDTFVNTGFIRWQADRQEWLKDASKEDRKDAPAKARDIDVDAIIDSIFAAESTGILPHNVLLPQIINVLVDLWETEGLYD